MSDKENFFTKLVKRNVIEAFIEYGNSNYSELLVLYFRKKYHDNQIKFDVNFKNTWDGSLDFDIEFSSSNIKECVGFSFNKDCTVKRNYHYSNYNDKHSGSCLVELYIDDIIDLIVKNMEVEELCDVISGEEVEKDEEGLTNYILSEIDMSPLSYLSMIDKEFRK